MSGISTSPDGSLFGNEIADDISQVKAIQKQCIAAMVANSAPVTLPAVAVGDTPIDSISKINTAILTVMNAVPAAKAFLNLKNAGAANLLLLTAKLAGTAGNSIQAKVEAGTASGVKITIVAEVYDNIASVAAAIIAINAGSLLVSASLVLEGTLVNVAFTNLAYGRAADTIAYTLPTFGDTVKTIGDQQAVVIGSSLGKMNDKQTVLALETAKALFQALRTKGWIA